MTTPGGPVQVDLELNPRGYVAGAQQAIASTEQLSTAVSVATRQQTLLQRALSTVTPFRAVTAALGGTTAAAAAQEQRLSQLAATQAITGQSARALTGTMNSLAREFPLGQRGAEQLVRSLQSVGITGKGSEQQVSRLGKSFSQLAGATGESADAVATGMVRLQRAFGSDLDAASIDKANDSLATLTARTGSSATGILSFSQAISPLTRQAGIGREATMGIAASFTKMGEDGFTGVNAISKVLTDMNRSLRDGTSELNTYASIVGKTREEFEALAKANPSEALAQVTEKLATPGAAGQRNLERIGLDGVRTQRVLTQLSQQGGIREAVGIATGNTDGATERGASAAFGGLNDAAEQAASAAEQLAIALGAPLLGPLEKFTSMIAGATGVAAKTAGASVNLGVPNRLIDRATGGRDIDLNPFKEGNQDAGEGRLGLGTILAGAGAAYGAVKLGGMAGVGRTLATSQVVRGLAAGYAESRGLDPATSRIARFGAPMTDALNRGYLGYQVTPAPGTDDQGRRNFRYVTDANGNRTTNLAGRAAMRTMAFGQGVGESVGPRPPVDPNAPRPSLREGLRSAARYGSLGLEGYSRIGRDVLQQGVTEPRDAPFRRSAAMPTVGGDMQQAGQAGRRMFQDLRTQGVGPFTATMQSAGMAMRGYQATVITNTGAQTALSRAAGAVVTPFMLAARAGAQLAGSLARAAASPAGAAIGGAVRGIGAMAMNPMMLAMVGGMVGYQRYTGLKQAREEYGTRSRDMSAEEGLNAYRESMDKAAESTVTLADTMKAASRQVNSSATTFKQALTIRAADREVADNTRNDVVQEYGGSADAVAAQIRAMTGNTAAPDEMNAVKVDLLRQFDEGFATEVLDRITAPTTDTRARTAAAREQIPVAQAQQLASVASTEPRPGRQVDAALLSIPVVGTMAYLADKGIHKLPGFQAGDRFNEPEVTKAEQTSIDAFMQQTAQRRKESTDRFGGDFATQQSYRDINTQFSAAEAEGDEDFTAQLSRTISQSMGLGDVNVDSGDLEKANGNFIQALANESEEMAKRLGREMDRGISIKAEGGLAGTEQMSSVAAAAMRSDLVLGSAFDNRAANAGRPVNQAVAASVAAPGNQEAFQGAIDALVEQGTAAGQSFSDVAISATRLARGFDQTTQEFAIAMAARQEALLNATTRESIAAPGVGLAGRAERAAAVVAEPLTQASTPEQRAEREEARREVAATGTEYAEMMKQRLLQTREFGISRQRMITDYDLQMSHQLEDFQRGVQRSEADFYLSRERAAANFYRSERRSQEDFGRQEERTIEDNSRSIARTEEDYQRSRVRSLREFQRQQKRMVEDAAKTLLDPYTRLQTQPVWDTSSLVQNMGQQLQAVADQVENLGTLRRRGLSTAVIDMLGLNDPGKAQQLARIVADTASDASLITTLNGQGRRREQGMASLQTPTNNRDLRRQQEDFERGRSQEEEDYRRGLGRQGEDFRRQLGRSRTDFQRSMARNREDYNRSMAEQLTDHNRQMSRQLEDQERNLDRQNTAFDLSLGRMGEDLERSQQAFNATFEELQQATTDAMAGKQVDWSKLMVDGMTDTTTRMNTVINNFRNQFGDLFGDITTLPDTPKAVDTGNGTSRPETAAEKRHRGETGGPSDADEGKDWAHPVPGARATSGFGPRSSPGGIGSTNHKGQDWGAPTGTAVKAFMDGIVQSAGRAGGYGNMIELAHGGGRVSRYAHLSQMAVAPGDRVDAGDRIGAVGSTGNSTGPHLHFETRTNGVATNPLTTMPKWAGQPVNLGDVAAAMAPTIAPQDLPEDVLRAIQLLGLTPEQFIASITGQSGGGAAPKGPVNTSANAQLGKRMAAARGWTGSDWNSLNALWQKESGWNHQADNPTSSAYGIPQGLIGTGDKPEGFYGSYTGKGSSIKATGGDPKVQIQWGLDYIKGRYGDPDAAWKHSQRLGWYAKGGIVDGAQVIGVGEAGPEAVVPLNQGGMEVLAGAMTQFLTDADARMMSTATARTHVTYHSESHEYDQRVVVESATVVSQDPDEMGRKLEAKARRDNLTAGPRRRG